MKLEKKLAIAGFLLGGFLIGFCVSEWTRDARATNDPCKSRYELRDSGMIGAVVRLDTRTGETKMIPLLEAVSVHEEPSPNQSTDR